MNTKLNRARGKRAEKAIADILGGRRVGVLGKEDVNTNLFSIEVKSRKRFSGKTFFDQSKSHCIQGKIPLVIVHIHGKSHSKDLVMMSLQDFEDLYRKLEVTHDN